MRSLRPRPVDRLQTALTPPRRGGRRVRRVRRLLSVALFLVAAALALRTAPEGGGSDVVLAARDLPIGSTVAAADLTTAHSETPPAGALSTVSEVVGQVLSGAVRQGEVLTDARIVPRSGPDPGPGRVAVPITPADGSAVALLSVGMHVAVLAVARDSGGSSPAATVLTQDAVVVALPPPQADGTLAGGSAHRLVVLAVPEQAADAVAAAGTADQVTLRFT
jgi:pilus assembly protein CpaB